MQKHFEKWAASSKELGAKGHMKDPGHPLEGTDNSSAFTKIVNPTKRFSMDPKKAITERTEAAARDLYGASRRAASPGWLYANRN